MSLRARVGRHTQHGGRQCQNWPDDQRTVINLLNRIPVAAGGSAGSLTKPVISGICSDELYRAISSFEDKYFPGQRSGYVDPGGAMLQRMEELAATPPGPIDFVAPGDDKLGYQHYHFWDAPRFPTGPTTVISGKALIIDSNELKFVGIIGDSNKVVKTVSASVSNAVMIEDGGMAGSGIHWYRLSHPRGNNVTIQAKDARGAVVTSFTLDVINLPKGPGSINLQVDPSDPKHLRVYAPKDDPDYIDTRMTGIGYEIYLKNGFVVYCSGMNTPIDVPDSLVDLDLTAAEPIDANVYDTLAQANEAIRRAPAKAKGVRLFAYYRGAGGAVIAPTIFSRPTTPRIIATLWVARNKYVDYVQRTLTGVAINLVLGQVHRALVGHFVRAPDEPEPPGYGPPPTRMPPAMTRLRNTAVDLQNRNPLRTAEVLSSPKVYRHTLTGGFVPSNYARIEMEGSMRLSTGADAQYGEGVYAWPPGFKTSQPYIDIEVPSGTGVETLDFGGGRRWVRMMPPKGDALPVKIVGTNVPQAQIDMGRKLVKP